MVGQTRTVTRRITQLAQNSPVYYALVIAGAAGWLLKSIDVFLRGNITLSAGAANGTANGENPGGLISNIDVDATAKPDGYYRGGKIKSLVPASILRGNLYDTGRFQDDLGGSGVVDGSAATTALNLRLPLRFANKRLKNPFDTALRLDQFDQVLLTIQMSSVAAMRVGNDRTVDLSAAYLEIVEHREYNPNFWPKGVMFEDDKYFQIQGANTRFVIDQQLPKSEVYLDWLLLTRTTNKQLADTILNRMTQYQASEQYSDLYERELRCIDNDYRTEDGTALTGTYYFDLAEGLLSNAVPWLNLLLDVNNPGTDEMYLRTRRLAVPVKTLPKPSGSKAA